MKVSLNGDQMKQLDQRTIEEIGIPSLVLMERAALSCVDVLESYPLDSVLVVCGSGNNGADGVAIARLLHLKGVKTAYILAGSGNFSEEMKTQLKIAEKCGTTRVENPDWQSYTTIVDALIGIGLKQRVRSNQESIIDKINSASAKVFAVDIPSGIHSGTGQVMGSAVFAEQTVTFGYLKHGLSLLPGAEYAGKVTVSDIGIYGAEIFSPAEILQIVTKQEMDWIPKRSMGGNKSTFGKVLVAAGSNNVCGAAYLASKAAFSSGCGMVKIATVPENRVILQQMLPEAMLETDIRSLKTAVSWADIIAVGPGMGQDDQAYERLRIILEVSGEKTVVLDGDALNLLSRHPELWELKQGIWILTPHPGELSRLMNCPVRELLQDLVSAAKSLAGSKECIAVCKNAATVIALPNGDTFVNTTGNDGMATAGSGDVLTGIIAGLLARGMSPYQSAPLACWIHGAAGNLVAEIKGKSALSANDLPEAVGEILRIREKGLQNE